MNPAKRRAIFERLRAAKIDFSDTLLWLKRARPDGGPENGLVRRLSSPGKGSEERDTYNRVIQMAKTRDGSGDGGEVAFKFGGDQMRFREVGLVLQDPSGRTSTP